MKQGLATAVLAALPFARAQNVNEGPKTTAACNDVAIFMARGNNAVYHDDRTKPFIDATCGKFQAQGHSCDYMDIVFDATFGVDFCPTIQGGAVNGVNQITQYNARCPDTLIVVNGYSQGSMVAGAALSGGGADACDVDSQTTGLNPVSAAGKAIKAALLWGDVKHTPNQVYNVLDGANKGPWPRTGANLARLNAYSSVLRSYCAGGDPVCAGGDNVTEHLDYFELYTDEASSWVVSKLNPFFVKPSSSSVVTTTSSTVAPTASKNEVSSAKKPSTTAAPTTVQSTESFSTTVQSTKSFSTTFTIPSNATYTTNPADSSATAYPITILPSQSKYYGNSTASASAIATVTLIAMPYGTSGVPAASSVYPDAVTTKAPSYPAAPAACPIVYETVTEYEYMYV
jgi:hypothetical protein